MVGDPPLRLGLAIWHTLSSDAAQRELLMAAAQTRFEKVAPILRRIEWAKRTADSLSTIRNDAVHTATAWTLWPDPSVVPDRTGTAPKRFRRITQHDDLQKHFELLHGDLIAVAHFVNALNAVVAFPGLYSLPRKPTLQSIPTSNLILKKARRRKRTKRQRQPVSSGP